MPRGRFKNTYELLNLRALKFSPVNKIHIFQCMGKIFCVEFQRYPLKFHTKYLTHTLKDMILYSIGILRALRFKSSYAFLKRPRGLKSQLACLFHSLLVLHDKNSKTLRKWPFARESIDDRWITFAKESTVWEHYGPRLATCKYISTQ